MAKSEYIRARIEPDLKDDVEAIFEALGLNSSEAINLFYRQVRFHKGLPFDIRIPNQETLQAMKNVEEGVNLVRCKDADDLFESLGI